MAPKGFVYKPLSNISSLHSSNPSPEEMSPTNWPAPNWVAPKLSWQSVAPASQRSRGRIPLKSPESFRLLFIIRDNCLKYPDKFEDHLPLSSNDFFACNFAKWGVVHRSSLWTGFMKGSMDRVHRSGPWTLGSMFCVRPPFVKTRLSGIGFGRRSWLRAKNSPIFLSRRFYRPIYF